MSSYRMEWLPTISIRSVLRSKTLWPNSTYFLSHPKVGPGSKMTKNGCLNSPPPQKKKKKKRWHASTSCYPTQTSGLGPKMVFIKYVFNTYQWKALGKEISKRVLTCPIHYLPRLKMCNVPRMTQNDHEPKNVGNLIESRFETCILTPLCYPKWARVLLKTEVELSVMLLFLFPSVDVVACLCRKSDLESFTSR